MSIANAAPITRSPDVGAVVTSVTLTLHGIKDASIQATSSWYQCGIGTTFKAFIALTAQTRARIAVEAHAHHCVCNASRHTRGNGRGVGVTLLALITHNAITVVPCVARALGRVRHAAFHALGCCRRKRATALAFRAQCTRPIETRITAAGYCVGSASQQTSRTTCCS